MAPSSLGAVFIVGSKDSKDCPAKWVKMPDGTGGGCMQVWGEPRWMFGACVATTTGILGTHHHPRGPVQLGGGPVCS